ncbi:MULTISPECIES: hypothetical protein [Pseudomonas]|uniref:Uncharacterized protein n=1 Tax=Pseudomonas tritici TaxID=2745518 RepID=A0A8H9YZ94_9PSED|nr:MULTISPECIES: hypothetical protein [Pseudomonas]MBP2873826.1 hypothetical protein [Pseudomonas sp. SWRI144]QXH85446.1 hypothetical protein HU722_0008220 [Pseudomonas tritici]
MRDDPVILELDAPNPTQALDLEWDEAARTLPLVLHDQDLEVTIARVWPFNLHEEDMVTTVEYRWDDVPVLSYPIQGPYNPDDYFPLVQYLSKSILSPEGIHRLTYNVSARLIGPTDSFPTFVNVDKTAPNGGNPGPDVQVDDEARHKVTDEYLVTHAGIPFWLARWFDMRIGDLIHVYYGTLPDVSQAATFCITRAHVQGAPIAFTVPEAHVRASGRGDRFVSCRLEDRGGNVGQFSDALKLEVFPVVLPDLPRPFIELAELTGVVLFEDTWPPKALAVTIPRVDDAEAGDKIYTYWNTHALEVKTVGEVQTWPIPVRVPWAIFAAGGFLARYPVRVRYVYERGSASKPSPDSFYEVDGRVAGPDPSGPDPINRKLAVPTVKGKTGDNVLTSVDSPGPVPVEVRLFENPKEGESLELCWNSDDVIVAAYDVQPGDVAGKLITLWVLWAVASSVNFAEVYYWTDNGINRQRSPSTPVRVNLDTLTGLKSPVLLNDSDEFFIACGTKPAPYEGVFIGVGWDFNHFAIDDYLHLYWTSYPSKNGSGEPFSGTDVFFEHRLTLDDRDRGQVEIRIQPFSLITLPGLVTDFGSAVVRYRLFKATGETGLSSRKLIYVNLKIPGGGTCLGPHSDGN